MMGFDVTSAFSYAKFGFKFNSLANKRIRRAIELDNEAKSIVFAVSSTRMILIDKETTSNVLY